MYSRSLRITRGLLSLAIMSWWSVPLVNIAPSTIRKPLALIGRMVLNPLVYPTEDCTLWGLCIATLTNDNTMKKKPTLEQACALMIGATGNTTLRSVYVFLLNNAVACSHSLINDSVDVVSEFMSHLDDEVTLGEIFDKYNR